jgi:hypothetical protein
LTLLVNISLTFLGREVGVIHVAKKSKKNKKGKKGKK